MAHAFPVRDNSYISPWVMPHLAGEESHGIFSFWEGEKKRIKLGLGLLFSSLNVLGFDLMDVWKDYK